MVCSTPRRHCNRVSWAHKYIDIQYQKYVNKNLHRAYTRVHKRMCVYAVYFIFCKFCFVWAVWAVCLAPRRIMKDEFQFGNHCFVPHKLYEWDMC